MSEIGRIVLGLLDAITAAESVIEVVEGSSLNPEDLATMVALYREKVKA